MAKKKISELPAGGALNGTELVPIVQTGTTKRITAQDIANLGNASGVEGSGTINRLAKFTATSTIGNSIIYENATGIGIGGNPNYLKFEVIGGTTAKRLGIGTNVYLTNSMDILALSDIGGDIPLGISGETIGFYTNSATERMRITSAGSVGIGCTDPTGKLEIRGLQSASKNLLLNLSKFDYGATQFYQNYSNTFYSGGKSLEIEVEGLPLLQLAVNNAGSAGKVIFPNGNVLLGTTTDVASSKLTIDSTTQGVLVPRMTETQINNINLPANGLLVYNTDQKHMCMYDGSNWKKFSMSNM
jgi:hypothetical protein